MPRRVCRAERIDSGQSGRDRNGERKPMHRRIFHDAAVYFGIEKIPPASERLRKQNIDHDAIRRPQKIYLFNDTNRKSRRNAQRYAADNRKTSVTEIEKFCDTEVRIGDTGEQSGADDCRRDTYDKQEKYQIGRHIPPFHQERG